MKSVRRCLARVCPRAPAWSLVAILLPGAAVAHFERPLLSTRAASLGGAFVAIADDPSAVVDNPAGICGLPSMTWLGTYQKPYGIDGLDDGYLATAFPVPGVSIGASWFHRGLGGALTEDLFTIAVARDVKRTSEDASLSIGASMDVARVAAKGDIGTDQTAVAFGAGVLLRPFAFIGLGYSVRNLNHPDIDLVADGGATDLATRQAAGIAYYWQERLVVTLETRQDATGVWRPRGGTELRVSRYLALRGGLEESHLALGVGVVWKGLGFDAGMTGHEALGSSYVVSLRYARPVKDGGYGARR